MTATTASVSVTGSGDPDTFTAPATSEAAGTKVSSTQGTASKTENAGSSGASSATSKSTSLSVTPTWIFPPPATATGTPPATVNGFGPIYKNDYIKMEWDPPTYNSSFFFNCWSNVSDSYDYHVASGYAESGIEFQLAYFDNGTESSSSLVCWLSFAADNNSTVGWVMEPIDNVGSATTWSTLPTTSTSSSSTSKSPSSTSGSASTTSTSSPSATSTPVTYQNTGLSGGAIAGIVVGVIVAVLAVLALVGALLWRKRRNKHLYNAPPRISQDTDHDDHNIHSAYIDNPEMQQHPANILELPADTYFEAPSDTAFKELPAAREAGELDAGH